MKPYRVEYVQLTGWETDEVGLWVAESPEWLLLRHIPADYVVDGYVLLRKAHIRGRRPGEHHEQVALVLQLKGVEAKAPAGFEFLPGVEMLRWVEQHYNLVEVADEEESSFFGWLNEADPVQFWLDFLTPEGELDARDPDDEPFLLADVQLIRFGTDYFNSLKLLWQHRQRQQLLKPSDN